MRICLYGSGSDRISEIYKSATFELGRKMAKRNHKLVFGAGSNGLMGAAARGVTDGGGEIMGIIPHFFLEEGIEAHYEHCTELIKTADMYERKKLLEDNAEAFVIVPGGIGTFDEFFAVLTNKQLSRHNKPMALYNVDGFYTELQQMMEAAIEKGFIKKNCSLLYKVFDDADALLDYLESDAARVKHTGLKDG